LAGKFIDLANRHLPQIGQLICGEKGVVMVGHRSRLRKPRPRPGLGLHQLADQCGQLGRRGLLDAIGQVRGQDHGAALPGRDGPDEPQTANRL
jgi:hypothetical protein